MGSPSCACPCLDVLLAMPSVTVAAVVSQPDRPRGRGLVCQPCPVMAHARERGIPIVTPPNVNQPETVAALAAFRPDAIVVVAFGQILKQPILDLAPLGCINVHASLLPRYRGAAPAPWAIARGETVTGVTTMRMNARLDAGAILLQRRVPIALDDTGGSLMMKLAQEGAALLPPTLEGVASGQLVGIPQDDRLATFAPKMNKAHGIMEWCLPAAEVVRRVRAFNPWPCATCEAPFGSGRVLRVLRARVERAIGPPGVVLSLAGEGPLVAAGEDAVRLLEVQPAGRTVMDGAAYARGRPMTVGDAVG